MLHLDTRSGTPFYLQIYEQVKRDILAGALPKGARLTATRVLAKELGVSRNTVDNAYAQLVQEGYVTSIVGSGFTVNAEPFAMHPPESVSRPVNPAPGIPDFPAASGSSGSPGRHDPAGPQQTAYRYDFRVESFHSSFFPLQQWRKLAADVLSDPDFSRTDIYRATKGDPRLCAEVAGYLYRSRGVTCGPGQVVISNGMRSALDALLTALACDDRLVAMEEPGFTGIRSVFRNKGLQILPVPVGPDGMDLRSLAASPARLVHVSPSRQYPTGTLMPLEKRAELLRWAEGRDALILEDDYDCEFRYNGRPLPSLQSLDTQGRVIYFGSFSKSLSPGMRIGYMVMPDWLRERFETVFAGFPCSVPWVEQAVLARFMSEGLWERHLRRTSQFIKKRHDVLMEALDRHLGDGVAVHGQGSGTHVLLEFAGSGMEADLIARAGRQGVRVYPTSHFWLEENTGRNTFLMLGYGLLDETEITDAVTLLKQAWFPGE